jgi:hypothetical protein
MSVSLSLNGSAPRKPLLTEEDVARWREERDLLREEIAAAQAKMAELTRKLEAAAVFMDIDVSAFEPLAQKAPEPVPSSSLYAAIARVIEASSAPMTPKMIREAILAGPDAGLIRSENYLYTAIKRLADKASITKQGDGYVSPW